MRPHAGLVLALFALATYGGAFATMFASLRKPRTGVSSETAWDWRLSLASALAYALAFNLVFFAQELALALSKAAVPGLHPVLYHNNHDWTGQAPIARLLQGAGALADLALAALAGLALVARRPLRSEVRLLVLWIAYAGAFQALPQVVAGAVLPGNDVGMATDYLGLGLPVLWLAAAVATGAMATIGMALGGQLLAFAPATVLRSPAPRLRFAAEAGLLPAALGTAIVLPYRIPGAVDQVVIVPVAVMLLGVVWMAAGAVHHTPSQAQPAGPPQLRWLVVALLLVLAVFQLVLRPGVPL